MTAPMESLAKIVELASEVGRRAAELERLALAAIIEQRDKDARYDATRSLPAGMPCVAEMTWDPRDEDVTRPAEPVDSSAAIPPEVVDHIARCGE